MSRTEKSRKAYRKRDVSESKKAHRTIHIETGGNESYMGDAIYGSIDGLVSTFAIVSGVMGAALSPVVILVLGFANLFADGFSMAVGNYLSTKAEVEYVKKERRRETWEVKYVPEGEKEEIREIYRKKGFKGKLLNDVVKVITSNKKKWIDVMMKEELGLIEDRKSPLKAGLATFCAFILVGFVPLSAYVGAMFLPINALYVSILFTSVALFLVGAAKSYIAEVKFIRGGMETLLVGGSAAAIAYLIGYLLRFLI